jgi:hypothetical protein
MRVGREGGRESIWQLFSCTLLCIFSCTLSLTYPPHPLINLPVSPSHYPIPVSPLVWHPLAHTPPPPPPLLQLSTRRLSSTRAASRSSWIPSAVTWTSASLRKRWPAHASCMGRRYCSCGTWRWRVCLRIARHVSTAYRSTAYRSTACRSTAYRSTAPTNSGYAKPSLFSYACLFAYIHTDTPMCKLQR